MSKKLESVVGNRLTNGDLLRAAEAEAFDALLTTVRNIRYQQNLSKRVIAVVVLSKGSWPLIRKKLSEIATAVDGATAGSYAEVEIPVDPDSGSY